MVGDLNHLRFGARPALFWPDFARYDPQDLRVSYNYLEETKISSSETEAEDDLTLQVKLCYPAIIKKAFTSFIDVNHRVFASRRDRTIVLAGTVQLSETGTCILGGYSNPVPSFVSVPPKRSSCLATYFLPSV